MIHELRLSSLPITPVMADAYQLFRDGHGARALASAYRLYEHGQLVEPCDWNAAHEIALDAGALELANRMLDDAPQGTDGLLAIALIRRTAADGDLAGAADAAAALPAGIDAAHPHLRDAMRGCYLARLRRRASAAPLVSAPSESPLTLVFQAMAHLELRAWPEVVERTKALVQRYPRWSRAWGVLAQALMALGDHAGARRALVEGRARCPGSRWLLAASVNIGAVPYDAVEGAVRGMPHAAPDGSPLAPPVLELAAWQLALVGEYEPAARLAEDADPKLGERVRRAAATPGRTARVPHRPIVQQDNTCVPTSVAMALGGRGIVIDPERAYQEMGGTAGVADWRLAQWLDEREVTRVMTRATVASLRAAVDAGAPLLVVRANFMSSHMMLLYGYDDRLRVFRVAEPMGSGDQYIPYEAVDAGVAFDAVPIALFVGDTAQGAAAFQAVHEDTEGRIAADARRAAMELRTDHARALFASLPDAHVTRLRLAFELSPVFTREDEFVASLLALARHPSCRPLERLNIMQALIGRGESAAAKEIEDQLPDLGPVLESMHRVTEAWREQDWPEMAAAAQAMVELTPSLPAVWWYVSIAKNAMGALFEAERALEIALEIDPHFAPAVQMSLAASRGGALAERAERLRSLLDANPLSTHVRSDLANVHARLGAFERGLAILEEGVAATPMDSAAYEALARYWLSTNRPDRAAAVGMPEGHTAATGEVHEGHAIDEWLERVHRATPFEPDEPALRALRALLDGGELTERHAFEARLGLLVHYVRMTGRGGYDRRVFIELLPQALPLPRAQFYSDMVFSLVQEDLAVGAADELLRWGDATLGDTEPDPMLRFARALLHVREGRVVEGSRTLHALAADGLAPAFRELARIALVDGQAQRAVEYWKDALVKEPGDGATWGQLVQFVARVRVKRALEFARDWQRARPYCPVAERAAEQLERAADELEQAKNPAGGDVRDTALATDDRTEDTPRTSDVAKEEMTAMRAIADGGTPAPCSDALREQYPVSADEIDLVRAAVEGRLTEVEDVFRRCLKHGLSRDAVVRVSPFLEAESAWAVEVARDVALTTGSREAVYRWLILLPLDQWGACVDAALAPFAQRTAALELMAETLVEVYASEGVDPFAPFICSRALSLAPHHAGLFALRLRVGNAVGHSSAVRGWARQVLSHPSCGVEAHLSAAEWLAEASPNDAMPALAALAQTRGGSRPTSALADAYLAANRTSDALETWDRLLQEQPSNADAIGAYILLRGDHRRVQRSGLVDACTQIVAPSAPGFAVATVIWFCREGAGPVPETWAECALERFNRMQTPHGAWNGEWLVLARMIGDFYRRRGELDKLHDFEELERAARGDIQPRPADAVSESVFQLPSFQRGDWIPAVSSAQGVHA